MIPSVNWLWGGAAIGGLASCWGYVKSTARMFSNLFIQRIELRRDDLCRQFVGYCVYNLRTSQLYERLYNSQNERAHGLSRMVDVVYEIYGRKPMVFWTSKGFPIFYSPGKEPVEANQKSQNSGGAIDNQPSSSGVISYIKGTVDIDRIISNAVNYDTKEFHAYYDSFKQQNRFFIKQVPNPDSKNANTYTLVTGAKSWWYNTLAYRTINYRPDELGNYKHKDTQQLKLLFFPEKVEKCIKEIKVWHDSRQWYNQRGIPWKRGWLLFGLPGTGKSSLVRAIAEDLDMPIFIFNLGELGNFDFIQAWKSMQINAPCIALIEDIDNVFHGRKNVSEGIHSYYSLMLNAQRNNNNQNNDDPTKREFTGGMLTFDTFLNCLDGVERAEGIFTIITTNDITKLDSALGKPEMNNMISTRPGRIDKTIELTYMRPQDKKALAERILQGFPLMLEKVIDEITEHPGKEETPAQFQEYCTQLALKCFWEDGVFNDEGYKNEHSAIYQTNES